MTVAALSLQLTDYRTFAIAEVGYGSTAYASLGAGEALEIDRLILQGERTFWLHPPGVSPPHVWSCLRDQGLLDLWADIAVVTANTVTAATATMATGVVTANVASFTSDDVGKTLVANSVTYTVATYTSATIVVVTPTTAWTGSKTFTIDGDTVLKAVSAAFYETMVGKSVVVTESSTYTVSRYHGTTSIRVDGDATAVSAKTFSIASDGTYRLPDDFESPESSSIVFVSESWVPDIQLMNERYVTGLRATQDQTGYPQYAAIRWTACDGTTAHQQELVTWPEPDQHYQVSLPFMVQPQGMSTANPYPRGGPEMADCILSVIFAVCEEYKTGRRGDRWAEAASKCVAAAQRDRTRHHNFVAGYMRPDSGAQTRFFDVKRLVLPA